MQNVNVNQREGSLGLRGQYLLGFEGMDADPGALRRTPDQKIEDAVGPEKLKAMKAYAKELRRKFPKMKEARVMRKTAEFFHVKLVKNDSR